MKKSNTAVVILKEWGLFIIFISIIILSRLYLWSPVKVDGPYAGQWGIPACA